VLFVLPLLFSACSGATASTSLDVTLSDFQFTPNTFTVPAGKEISVHLVNNGAVVHNFIILKLGTTAGDSFDDADQANVYWEQADIPPGAEINPTFTAPTDVGDYQIVCKTAGHIAAGMIGKLTVVAGE